MRVTMEFRLSGHYVADRSLICSATRISTHTCARGFAPRAATAIAILPHGCCALFSFGRVAFNRVEGAGGQCQQRKKWQDFGVRHSLGPIMA
jgi:hypothetical protein